MTLSWFPHHRPRPTRVADELGGAIVRATQPMAQRAEAPRPAFACTDSAGLRADVLLEPSTVVSKAIWTTMLANPFDMNVSTLGSLLLRLSHHRRGHG